MKSDNAAFCLLFREEKQLTLCCTSLGQVSSSDEVYFQSILKKAVAPNSNISENYFEIGSCLVMEVVGFFYCPVLFLLITPQKEPSFSMHLERTSKKAHQICREHSYGR